jgi:hypothetical protein
MPGELPGRRHGRLPGIAALLRWHRHRNGGRRSSGDKAHPVARHFQRERSATWPRHADHGSREFCRCRSSCRMVLEDEYAVERQSATRHLDPGVHVHEGAYSYPWADLPASIAVSQGIDLSSWFSRTRNGRVLMKARRRNPLPRAVEDARTRTRRTRRRHFRSYKPGQVGSFSARCCRGNRPRRVPLDHARKPRPGIKLLGTMAWADSGA